MCIRDRPEGVADVVGVPQLYMEADEVDARFDKAVKVVAVSYTHLDVYKRQPPGCIQHDTLVYEKRNKKYVLLLNKFSNSNTSSKNRLISRLFGK